MIGTKYYFCANARLSEFPGVIRVCRVAQFAICWLDFVQKERSSQQREVFDVIVVGGGNAAMCAALAARRIGASVLVLERATEHMRGGNTRHTRNIRCSHAATDQFFSGSYSDEEHLQDLIGVTGGPANLDLAKLAIRKSSNCLPG
jgi:tricarballylate dehydrogenase